MEYETQVRRGKSNYTEGKDKLNASLQSKLDESAVMAWVGPPAQSQMSLLSVVTCPWKKKT